MCGEEELRHKKRYARGGSPPHVRGRAVEALGEKPMGRITPACAGKRLPPWGRESPCQDHPRMCGEEAVTLLYAMADEGSPPHVRGRVRRRPQPLVGAGITPACAGKRLNGSLL